MSFTLHGFHWHAVLEGTLLNRSYIYCRQSTQVQFYKKESTQAVKSHQLVLVILPCRGCSSTLRLFLSYRSAFSGYVGFKISLLILFIYLFVFRHLTT